MAKFTCSIVFVALYAVAFVNASTNVTNIKDCAALTPRDHGPKNVYDLRVDDIKVVGALGDR
jgi:hypothetical protein